MAHTNDVGAELSRLRQLQAEQDEQWHQLKRRLESVDPAIRFAIGELPTTNATAAAVIPNGVRV